jgi:carboxyl-terminal processing protease
MHQRTWLSILTLPIVAAFTYPVVFNSNHDMPRIEIWSTNRDSRIDIAAAQEVLALIRSDYVDEPDIEKVISGGIKAVLEQAHPMNSYLTPEDLRLSDPSSVGIGIAVIKKQMCALVISVIPGSPAARLGLKVGDVIQKLDNHPVDDMSVWTLERKLHGRAGSTMTILRYLPDTLEFDSITLRSEIIKAPPIVVSSDSRASIITLTDLNHGRFLELKAILENLNHNLPIILDIRQCAGGSLVEVASVAGMFIPNGPLVTIQEVGKQPILLSVTPTNVCRFANVAVLQGRYTIGAAEVLSAALKRHLIPIFGDRTYGLGVERTRFLLRCGGAADIVNKYWIGAGGEPLGINCDNMEDQRSIGVLKNNVRSATSSPGYCGVLPNYSIQIGKSVDDWLPMVLEIIEAEHKSNAVNLPMATKLTCNY